MLLDTPQAQIGFPAEAFALTDADSQLYHLNDLKGENGLLVAFICNHCPYVQAIIDRLVADAKLLQKEGIGIVAINSNDYRQVPADDPQRMKLFAQKHQFSFPYLIDEDQSVARSYGAVCTPDFFGFNAQGQLQYRGRIDDAGMSHTANRQPELLSAMRMIASSGKGPVNQYPSIGCSIKWRS